MIGPLTRSCFCAAIAHASLGCGGDPAPPDGERAPPRIERVSVRAELDGGFTTLLRGASDDHFDGPRDVALDGAGNIVVVGGTESPDFPTTEGSFQTTFASGGTMLGSFPEMDVFVTKLHPDGTIAWSTFIGGPNYDRAYAVEIDEQGDIYVAGRAGAGFPTTAGVVQPEFSGDSDPNRAYGPQDGFVLKLSADGTTLLWSTYLGDGNRSFVRDIDIDREGHVFAALFTQGVFPLITPGAFQTRPGGREDNVVLELDATGTRVVWATYIGGPEKEGDPTIRVDTTGRVFLLTCTSSDGWVPASAPAAFQSERRGAQDLLLIRFSRDGDVEARTYLGGSEDDVTETHHLALDAQGRPVVAIPTVSRDLPIPAGSTPFRSTHGPSKYDGYSAILSADLDELIAATYLGGGGRNGGFEGVAVDATGAVYLGGATGGGLQATSGALQSSFGGNLDAFVAKLSPTLDRAIYLSYWGGPGHDGQRSLVIDREGHIISVGQTTADVFVVRFVVR